MEPSAFGTELFRVQYSTLSGATHAYERVYDFATKTSNTASVIQDYFGHADYQVNVNSNGEAMLSSNAFWFDYGALESYVDVRVSFYLP